MAGKTDYSARASLNYITGRAAPPPLPQAFMALFTTAGSDNGTGFVEVSGGGYARVATTPATWAAPSGSSPVSITNALAISFPTATASWGNVTSWGFFDAATGGNLLTWDYFGAYSWLPCYISAGSPGVFDVSQHGYQAGDTVVVTSEFGGQLPTTPGSWSGLLTVANPVGDTFNTGVNCTSTGEGMIRKVVSQSVGVGVSMILNPGSLVLTES